MPKDPTLTPGLLPMRIARDFSTYRLLIRQSAWRDAVLKYKGSFLGIVWSFLVPLMILNGLESAAAGPAA